MISRRINFLNKKIRDEYKKLLGIKTENYNLPGIIGQDLLKNSRLPLFLFICIIITAIMVIITTHNTRLLIAKREQLLLEHESLGAEWQNLILEEKVLSDNSRIERIAIEKLQMQHVNPSCEKIVILNKIKNNM